MTSTRRALAYFFSLNILFVVAAVAHGLIRTGNPSRYFGEGRWTTLLSCLQLLAAAIFAFHVFQARRRDGAGRGSRLWLLISTGFVFLAFDDAFQLHERMDDLVHRAFALHSSGLTDRIDDGIIGVYALIGLLTLRIFRHEVLRFRKMLRALGVGCVCAFASIACDTLSNRPDFFHWLTGDLALARKLEGWFAVGDGGFQLLAIGSFVAAFYLARAQARLGLASSLAPIPAEPPRAAGNRRVGPEEVAAAVLSDRA